MNLTKKTTEDLKGILKRLSLRLTDASLSPAQKEAFGLAVDKYKAEIAKREADTSIKKAKPSTPKVPTVTIKRGDIYTHLKPQYTHLSQAKVKEMNGGEYKAVLGEVTNKIIAFSKLEKKESEGIAEMFLSRHLSKEAAKSTPPSTPVKPVKKEVTKPQKPVTPKVKKRQLSYKQALPKSKLEQLEAIEFNCGFRKEIVTEETELTVPTTAKPGDLIIYKEDGHPIGVFQKEPASKMCRKPVARVNKSTYEGLKAANEETKEALAKEQAKNKNLNEKIKAASDKSQKPTTSATKPPIKSTTPPAKTSPKSTEKQTQKAAKGANECSVEQQYLAQLIGQMHEFLASNIYKGIWKEKSVEGMYRRKMEDGTFEVVVKVKTYSTINREEWFTMCTRTLKLKKIDRPKNGTIRILIPKSDIKTLYTTTKDGLTRRDARKVYSKCLLIYQKFYKCQQEGTCSETDRESLKTAYQTCGDLHKKFEKTPQWMNSARQKVLAEKRAGEKFWDAWRRIYKKKK